MLVVSEERWFNEKEAKRFWRGEDRILFATVENFASDGKTDRDGDIDGWMRAFAYADNDSASFFEKNKKHEFYDLGLHGGEKSGLVRFAWRYMKDFGIAATFRKTIKFIRKYGFKATVNRLLHK